MASEQPVEAAPLGGSLSDRISKPDEPTASETPEQTSDQADGASAPLGGSDLREPEYNVEVKLSDLQADPNNPLYSVKNFEDLGLDPRILKGLSAMNFRKPSKIQERALPLLLGNPPKNLVGQSQSGTGKTAAFVLNALSRVDLSTEQMQKTPQALILAPTRELARQIVGVVSVMGQFLDGLIIGTAVPADINNRPKRLECSIAVGTPGTVMDMIKRRIMVPNKLKVLVLDEADNMLDQQGLGDQCIRVKALLPRDIQVVLFSATFPDHVHAYAAKFAPNANELTLQHEELTVEGIKQLYLDCSDEEDKYKTLVQLYGLLTVGSSIIFVQTRTSASEIEKRMVAEGHTVASLTGGIDVTKRDEIIDKFRSGEAKVLITTNVLARGIDVSTVSMVINYDIPELHRPGVPERQADFQTYLHRIGRTGRFGRVGVSISFVSNREEWDMLNQIQRYFNTEIQRVDTKDWDEVEDIIKKTIKNTRANAQFGKQ
ncbi:ATP-dependent RNA helicase DBP5 [Aspergillus clavatus NRRL 1]|uniref:ATP-dependent RNA helicase dbp5 n=1 Tax=Aspergillus clavatus (strain ATCC 1007 / CBS 513.65 / DSM 816 / NCTC 3887 / NRRL 1 / QM 1276 / 107) TaxID=344612 RepID=DBP5_ASPCL|nr:ATP dependent RNA helicase (Dbp5), putative [Aspergillus clavatus NRRL 1]A1CFV3.1 RecName: Full=ATP-dependent RNA helicase dbp5 [Aspergillus clavatus NRRL 1]EAW11752.1 ATP dependent RNA helicase (Dbp5), putative [Aspergillus clavatus NRRL 1]